MLLQDRMIAEYSGDGELVLSAQGADSQQLQGAGQEVPTDDAYFRSASTDAFEESGFGWETSCWV